MARKLRLEYEGAMYHVINRGNYRAAVFGEEGAREAFMGCLFEACEKADWVLHAYVLMSNHYRNGLNMGYTYSQDIGYAFDLDFGWVLARGL